MRQIMAMVGVTLGFAFVLAAAPVSATSQQAKMKSCNAEANQKSLKGDDRKAFMKTCLSASAPAAGANTQQAKMKHCNSEASAQHLKGDQRKQFMSTCLKGS